VTVATLSGAALPAAPADGRRRAAIALVALGPERAAAVLRNLSETEARVLAVEVARLGSVTGEEVRATMGELARGISNGGSGVLPAPGKRFAKELLVRALGDERGGVLAAELDVPEPFAWLAEADPEPTAEALAAEPPAAIALALAHTEPKAAARLLTRLPDDLRTTVARRIAGLGAVHPDTLRQVEAGLRARIADVLNSAVQKVSGPTLLADVLSRAGRDASRDLLSALSQSDPELAEATRAALFTFDDVCALEPRTMQVLLRSVDSKELATALATSSDAVKDRVLSNLSERARDTLHEEIDLLSGVRASVVAEARAAVVTTARRLEEEGTVVLTRAGVEDDE
jgi:flagellar motor switch protein FliG